MARRQVVRLYLKSGQVIRFLARDITLTKGPDGEYTKVQSGPFSGEELKGFAPEQIAAWTLEQRRWWQW